MRMKTKLLSVFALGLIVGIGALGASAVSASTPAQESGEVDGQEVAITGSALEQASAVALGYLGEGRVTETEVGDEESYYEVEVTLPDGSEVDVQLDENFNVVGSERDGADDRD
jgi:uncharacterized membrane protein YkoI